MKAQTLYRGLSNEARFYLAKARKTLLARFWDCLKYASFKGGPITVHKARLLLPRWKDGLIRKALKESCAFIESQNTSIERQHLGEFFGILHPLGTRRDYYMGARCREIPRRVASMTLQQEASC